MGGILLKRAIITLALIPVVIFCLLSGILSFAVGEAHITNNQILDEHEQEFYTIPHPTNTSAVAFKRKVTRPTGKGSNCFYFVGEVRRFSGNRSSIEAFYADKQVQLQFFNDNQLDQEYRLYGLNQLC